MTNHLSTVMLAALLAIGSTATANAGPMLLEDDFQDGNADGWGATGDGDIAVSHYSGNYSLRVTRQARALRAVPAPAEATVEVSGALAAQSLSAPDDCLLEASGDGQSWVEVLRVAKGADDGLTLYRGAAPVAIAAGVQRIVLRLRANTSGRGTCWFDDITVAGMATVATGAARAPATSAFNGRLVFDVATADARFTLLRDTLRLATGKDNSDRVPPRFDFTFVQVDDRLVPTHRGAVPANHPWWEWAVEPGRVWSEAGDGEWSRAEIPFAWEERNANCLHNGLLTFRFNAAGTIERLDYRIAQETCAYFQFDAWGTANASFTPGTPVGAATVAAEYRRERAGRLPVKPISALAHDVPGIDPAAFGSAAELSPGHVTVFGVVWNGVHYVGGCETRRGPYPLCDELLLPSYSVAKSVVSGLGLMRLEQLSAGAKQALVVDYVPECRAAGGWEGVTFDHLADMASGRYQSAGREVDEDATMATPFFRVDAHADKVRIACARYPRRVPPGTRWVYHTTDTYLLGTSMQAYWRRLHGANADFFRDALVDGLYAPLGLSPAVASTRRTYDAIAQPFTGWGLMLLRDDIAKLALFMVSGTGELDGQPVVNRPELSAALQRSASDTGFSAARPEFRYNNGLWAWNAAASLACKAPLWVPFMSGYGGISVVLMPNGAVYYYFSDNSEFRWARALREANKLAPFCTR
jgi:hypothetical protein